MTTIDIRAVIAPTITGLTAIPSIRSVLLEWNDVVGKADPLEETEREDHLITEVWRGTVNNRASAALVGEVDDTNFTDSGLTTATTYYYWVRSRSVYGISNGGWEPLSPTTGVSALTEEVVTLDVQDDAVSTVTIVKDETTTGIGASYGVWTDLQDITILGNGFPTAIDSIITFDWNFLVSGSQYGEIVAEYLLTNTTAGSTTTDTGFVGSTDNDFFDHGTAGQDFTNPENAEVEDGVITSGTATGGGGAEIDHLVFFDFDFASSIPANTVLVGIQVEVKIRATGGSVGDRGFDVELSEEGSNFSTSDGVNAINSGRFHSQLIDGTLTTYTFGSSSYTPQGWWYRFDNTVGGTDLNREYTMADVKTTNFGVAVYPYGEYRNGTYEIDYVGMKVYYTTEVLAQLEHRIAVADNSNSGDLAYLEMRGINKFVETLNDGDSYKYKVRMLKWNQFGAELEANAIGEITTIRQYKK